MYYIGVLFFFSSRRRHTRFDCDWSSDVCSSDLILNIDHPDIAEFIECKRKEERKAHVLIEQGYDSSIDGAAYSSIFFQNANHSVRVTDDFMRAVVEDKDWWTKNVHDGQPVEKLRARDQIGRAHV